MFPSSSSQPPSSSSAALHQQPLATQNAWAKFERLLSMAGVHFKAVAHEEGGARMDIIRSVNHGTNKGAERRNVGGGGGGVGKSNGTNANGTSSIPTNVFSSPVGGRGVSFSPNTIGGGGSGNARGAAPSPLASGDPTPLNARLDIKGSTVNANNSSAAPLTLTPLEVALVSAQWNRMVPPTGGFGGANGNAAALRGQKEADLATGAVPVPGGYLVEPTHIRPHQNTSSEELMRTFRSYVAAGSAAPALSVASELLQRDAVPLSRMLQDYLPHMTLVQMQEVLCVKAPSAATLSI